MKIVVIGYGLLGQHISKLYPYIPVISHTDCDITSPFDIHSILSHYNPDIVINCAGIVSQSSQASNVLQLFKTNSQGPHLLQAACDEVNCKLIQISTDCVFSGDVGGYCEIDVPTPNTLYGMSKALGEITEFPHLTVRTSFVGFPDEKSRGLLAWANKQEKITGYDSYIWNGITATELAKVIIEKIIPKDISNVIHVYGQEITNKYQMLLEAKEVFGWNYEIIKESDVAPEEDRHIKNHALTSEVPDFKVEKTFKEMLQEMKEVWNV